MTKANTILRMRGARRLGTGAGLALAVALAPGGLDGQAPEWGEVPPPSARDLDYRILVDASAEEILADWTDPEVADRFFGVSSTIEPRVGGTYEIRFLPGNDAAARANSTEGARILALEPGRHLAFEWRLPPWAQEPARSAPPTRVDLWVSPGSGHPAAGGRTILQLRHSGYGEGAAWDQVRSFFHWSWFDVLARYKTLREAPAEG